MPTDPARLAQRQILLSGLIDDDSATTVIAELLYLQHLDPVSPLILLVDSPGGKITPGMAIVDVIDTLTTPVHTHCCGEAHAMAALIVAHGVRGQRSSTPAGLLSVTMPTTTEGEGPTDDPAVARLTAMLVELAARDTGRSAGEVQGAFSIEARFTPEEALRWGLIDRTMPIP